MGSSVYSVSRGVWILSSDGRVIGFSVVCCSAHSHSHTGQLRSEAACKSMALVGSRDFFRLAVMHTLGSLFFFALAGFSLIPVVIPGSIIVLEWALGGYVTMTAWVAYRILFERSQTLQNPDRRRVVGHWCGQAGSLVGQMLRLRPWGIIRSPI